MSKLYILLAIAAVMLINCYSSVLGSDKENIFKCQVDKKIELHPDLVLEEKLQAEVDAGHQPWRLEAIDVAYETIKNDSFPDVKYENCILVSEMDCEAIVKCKSKQNYFVNLKRIVKPNKGIWTAISIEICSEETH